MGIERAASLLHSIAGGPQNNTQVAGVGFEPTTSRL